MVRLFDDVGYVYCAFAWQRMTSLFRVLRHITI
jgi:hypothetical protein